MKKSEKILVAMSGGVDSSVVAALLVEQGFDVTGAFMINYETQIEQMYKKIKTDSSCWRSDYQDVLRVCAKLGIQLLKLDFTKEYKREVLDYMYSEYKIGRTPNPDVLCNKFVKFGVWLDKVKELGFDKMATGHYARLQREFSISNSQFTNNSKFPIFKLEMAKDKDKDQTYFLHQLNQKQLGNTLFPLGNYTKKEVRELAWKMPEQQWEILFIMQQ